MSFFGKLFGGAKKAESIALIEMGPESVAVGLAHFKEGMPPVIVYAHRVPIAEEGGAQEAARTLATLGEQVIRAGAPLLVRAAGTGRINSALVSVKAPWQETTIRSEKVERTTPFTFTRDLLKTAIQKSTEAPKGRLLADEFVIATMLDGYAIKEPIGRRASRVSIVILSSFIDEAFSQAIAATLRKLFHTESVRLVAASATRYEALRDIFPHEEDYLTVDTAGSSIVTTLIRHGLLSAVEHALVTKGAKDAWLAAFTKTLEMVTKRYPLPRKIFLLTVDGEPAVLKQQIEGAPLAPLRLSDEPPIVVPIAPAQLTDLVRLAPDVAPDLGLELMAAFWRRAGA